MTKYTLIQNARLVREGSAKLEDADLLLKVADDNRSATLVAIESRIARASLDGPCSIINLRGNVVAPCFTDLSVCLREPGGMYKESIAKTLDAARHGGYDALLSFFEPTEQFSSHEVLAYWQKLPKDDTVALLFTAQAFLADGMLAELDALLAYPDTVLTNRFVNSDSRAILLEAMQACHDQNKTFVLYPRVASLARNGAVNRHIAAGLKVSGISPVAESLAVAEGIMLAEEAECRLHISGISTEKSVMLVREAKKIGLPVTADTAPAYFYFNESEVFYRGAEAKLMPPLREERDRLAVIEGLADGTIDAIASHHTPNAPRDYRGVSLADAPFGAVGLEVTLPAAIEALLSRGLISTVRLFELLSIAPRRILKEMGVVLPENCSLTVGDTPNFNIVSLDSTVMVDEAFFHGRATNTPFKGAYLQGRVERTFRHGIEIKG